MSKSRPLSAKPLSAFLGQIFQDAYAKQGFASRELVTRWAEIAGAEIAAYSQPLKIQWARPVGDQPPQPATLVLRVEGPRALEIQHASDVIIERVNRFFGWSAVGRIALRQAPLSRPAHKTLTAPVDQGIVDAIAGQLTAIDDDDLRTALARLGAAIKRN